MKIKFFTLILTLFIFSCHGQVVKCKTTGFAFRSKDETTDLWSKWSEFEAVEILLTIDGDNNRIKIFSKQEQVYDIIKTYESVIDDDGDKTSKWLCINEDGLKCFIRLVKLNSQEGRIQIYVDFDDIMFAYNIYRLD